MEVEFYKTRKGARPVFDFLMELDSKSYLKTLGVINLLAEYGNNLGMPFSKKITKKIYELRVIFASNNIRILYFFHKNKAVLTNAFIKKQNKTPRNEIEKAIRYYKDYLLEEGNYEIKEL